MVGLTIGHEDKAGAEAAYVFSAPAARPEPYTRAYLTTWGAL
ncbi:MULTISPECIES: hypothetical protein [unclassified Streptomyces]